jgi:hypothetical protein
MKYIHSDQKVTYLCSEEKKEQVDLQLNLSNIIKLLIPAEFLQIETLWDECINFIGLNIEAITKMKINMNFLQS